MPGFDNIECNEKDVEYLLQEYQKVFVEQFYKIDKEGKAIHADIHPGNIFINPEALRTRKGKLFTLIDTGNVIDMNVEQSMRALNLSQYIQYGNTKDIAEYVMEGAILPSGMTKEKATELIQKDLDKIFFDYKTMLGEKVTEENILAYTDNIMQKHGIISGSSQLNLNKTKISARNSLDALKDAMNEMSFVHILGSDSKTQLATRGLEEFMKGKARNSIYDAMISKQEKENLKQLTASQKALQKHNPNNKKTNSEEYIAYKLKQNIKS